jgi:hypothetical protein
MHACLLPLTIHTYWPTFTNLLTCRSKSLPRSGPNTFEDAEDAVPLPARSVSFSSNTSDTSDSSNTSNASNATL